MSAAGTAGGSAASAVPGHLRAGILGASGYGGAGLLHRLGRHSGVTVAAVASRQYLGKAVGECWPQLAGLMDHLIFQTDEEVIAACDVVFCSTPHGATAPLVRQAVDAGVAVIDLSADFRLDAASYKVWYRADHPHPELLPEARYGLVELHRDELVGCRLVASPGCNATAASLALAPLAAAGLLGPSVVASIITGVSGAGRAPSQLLHFSEASDNVRAYNPSGNHRHTAEIEATVGRARAKGKRLSTHGPFEPYPVSFTPHLAPLVRGILATCTTRPDAAGLSNDALLGIVADYYAGDPLIHVQEELPQTKAVAGSDRAILSARYDAKSGHVLTFCVIDNLGKGAAGQAVQGFNVAFGFDERESLELAGVWP